MQLLSDKWKKIMEAMLELYSDHTQIHYMYIRKVKHKVTN